MKNLIDQFTIIQGMTFNGVALFDDENASVDADNLRYRD